MGKVGYRDQQHSFFSFFEGGVLDLYTFIMVSSRHTRTVQGYLSLELSGFWFREDAPSCGIGQGRELREFPLF
jgi:hypothetical protein